MCRYLEFVYVALFQWMLLSFRHSTVNLTILELGIEHLLLFPPFSLASSNRHFCHTDPKHRNSRKRGRRKLLEELKRKKMGIKDLLRFMKPYVETAHIKKYAGKRVTHISFTFYFNSIFKFITFIAFWF